MRRVFKTKTFGRWSGNVYKKRIPVPGRGKRGGARTVVGSNLQDRWFYIYGYDLQ